MAKKKKQSLAALWITLIAVAAAIFLVRHFHIKNFHIVEPEVLYTSGQPRGMDYTRMLYKYHVAAIVNVRSASEHREKNWHNEEITFGYISQIDQAWLYLEKRYTYSFVVMYMFLINSFQSYLGKNYLHNPQSCIYLISCSKKVNMP